MKLLSLLVRSCLNSTKSSSSLWESPAQSYISVTILSRYSVSCLDPAKSTKDLQQDVEVKLQLNIIIKSVLIGNYGWIFGGQLLYVTRNMTHSFLSFCAQIFLSHFSLIGDKSKPRNSLRTRHTCRSRPHKAYTTRIPFRFNIPTINYRLRH